MSDASKAGLGRRDFLKRSVLAGGLLVLPSYVAGQSPDKLAPNDRLRLAFIGCGGRGRSHIVELIAEDYVAFCDVDMARAKPDSPEKQFDKDYLAVVADAEKRGARWFTDYRVMFEELGDSIDAVVISTPDHMHFPIALSAINLGKHVYVEKPLTHTVEEARILREAAARTGVVTQMGNQGHSNEGARLIREWVQAGVIGPIREVHSWTDRPKWPQGVSAPDHSEAIPVVPKTLDWDLWLGVAAPRPYDPAYLPFDWRGYYDFGTGAFGDMACHIMDPVNWALEPGWPMTVEAISSETTAVSFPKAGLVKYAFPAQGKNPDFTFTWYSGGLKPTVPDLLRDESEILREEANGSLFIGDDAVIFSDTYSKSVRILPMERFMDLRKNLPPKSIPRVKGSHQQNWIEAIKGGHRAVSDFEYAAPFSEMVLLGSIAERLGERLEVDPEARRFKDSERANALLAKTYPHGWILS